MAVSAVKKLERCERLGRARQGEAELMGGTFQVIKYKVKIKDCLSSNQIKFDRALNELRCSLNYVASSHEELIIMPAFVQPACQPLQNVLQAQSAVPCSNHSSPSHCKLQLQNLQAVPNLPPLPPTLPKISLPSQLPRVKPQLNLLVEDAQSLQDYKEADGPTRVVPDEDAQSLQDYKEADGPPRVVPDVDDTEETITSKTSSCKRQLWEAVKKLQCECCGMEEECTGGYEEKVRVRLRGHWLCGLCQEAVGEERKRVGGSVQAALAAHMQPCRRFSSRVRAKVSPPSAEVALPHAVCRLLCRHLSTPSPRGHSSPSPASLSRSDSCMLPN